MELEFRSGLTLLTGETGAGKSILVDALGLLLGERASLELIRTGEERADVEALFESPAAGRIASERGLAGDGDELVLRREIHVSGKGRAMVNGALVPVSVLRELAPHLVIIHGQHEPRGLLDAAAHLELLDHEAGLHDDRDAVAVAFRALRELEARLENLRGDRRDLERRREMLEYQAAEIEAAKLQPGEEEALRQDKRVQANASRLASLSAEAHTLLYEDEAAVVTRLGQVFRRVEELAAIDPRFVPHVESGESVRAQVEDLALFLRDYQERLDVRPGRLDEIESRLARIDGLKRKYGASVEEVIGFGARCRTELAELAAPEERERALEHERRAALDRYLTAARRLSKARRAASRELQARVQEELAGLAMEKTRFAVRFTPDVPEAGDDASMFSETGLETAEFLLSPNPGEELRPLARIASGGELSRIMLALKSVASLDAPGKTLVFDEVDAGIGGRVAEVVGRKLRKLAERHQVLCVTHLPQIASQADDHLLAIKRVERGRTLASVRRLEEPDRVEELARMLGGEQITETARRHAREMMKQNLRR